MVVLQLWCCVCVYRESLRSQGVNHPCGLHRWPAGLWRHSKAVGWPGYRHPWYGNNDVWTIKPTFFFFLLWLCGLCLHLCCITLNHLTTIKHFISACTATPLIFVTGTCCNGAYAMSSEQWTHNHAFGYILCMYLHGWRPPRLPCIATELLPTILGARGDIESL